MAKNQGLIRLTAGVRKKLNSAEQNRGFIFISKDTGLQGALHKKFNVIVNGNPLLLNTCLDSYGRITGASVVTKLIGNNIFTILIDNGHISIDCPKAKKTVIR